MEAFSITSYLLFVFMYYLGLLVFRYIDIIGKENITDLINTLIISNHWTYIDSFLIRVGLVSQRILFFHQSHIPYDAPDKKNFYKTKAWTWFMNRLKNIPVDRKSMSKELRDKLITIYCKVLSVGSLILFPEGGRTKVGRQPMEIFQTGVAKTILIMTLKNPNFKVLPVYIDKINEMMPREIGQKYHKIKVRVHGKMIIGKPISFLDICIEGTEEEIIEKIKERGKNAILALKP